MASDHQEVALSHKSQLDEFLTLGAWMREADALVDAAAKLLLTCLGDGGCVYFCGNGGSALEAQHFSAELVGRYRRARRPLAGVALSADGGALTGIANDYGYDQVFARQVAALGRPGDVLIVLSTSGRSPSVLEALRAARLNGLKTLALTGADGCLTDPLSDVSIRVPSSSTARVQEIHLLIVHLICETLDSVFVDV